MEADDRSRDDSRRGAPLRVGAAHSGQAQIIRRRTREAMEISSEGDRSNSSARVGSCTAYGGSAPSTAGKPTAGGPVLTLRGSQGSQRARLLPMQAGPALHG